MHGGVHTFARNMHAAVGTRLVVSHGMRAVEHLDDDTRLVVRGNQNRGPHSCTINSRLIRVGSARLFAEEELLDQGPRLWELGGTTNQDIRIDIGFVNATDSLLTWSNGVTDVVDATIFEMCIRSTSAVVCASNEELWK